MWGGGVGSFQGQPGDEAKTREVTGVLADSLTPGGLEWLGSTSGDAFTYPAFTGSARVLLPLFSVLSLPPVAVNALGLAQAALQSFDLKEHQHGETEQKLFTRHNRRNQRHLRSGGRERLAG